MAWHNLPNQVWPWYSKWHFDMNDIGQQYVKLWFEYYSLQWQYPQFWPIWKHIPTRDIRSTMRERFRKEENELLNVEDVMDEHRSLTWFEYHAYQDHLPDVDELFHPQLPWRLLQTKSNQQTPFHLQFLSLLLMEEVQLVVFSNDHRDYHHNHLNVSIRYQSNIFDCYNFVVTFP